MSGHITINPFLFEGPVVEKFAMAAARGPQAGAAVLLDIIKEVKKFEGERDPERIFAIVKGGLAEHMGYATLDPGDRLITPSAPFQDRPEIMRSLDRLAMMLGLESALL